MREMKTEPFRSETCIRVSDDVYSFELMVRHVRGFQANACPFPRIAFRLWDYPLQFIEMPFSSLREYDLYSGRTLYCLTDTSLEPKLHIAKGKSCLLAMPRETFSLKIHSIPLYVMLLNAADGAPPRMSLVGCATIPLSDQRTCSGRDVPMYDLMGNQVATIHIAYRMSIHGKTLHSHFTVLKDNVPSVSHASAASPTSASSSQPSSQPSLQPATTTTTISGNAVSHGSKVPDVVMNVPKGDFPAVPFLNNTPAAPAQPSSSSDPDAPPALYFHAADPSMPHQYSQYVLSAKEADEHQEAVLSLVATHATHGAATQTAAGSSSSAATDPSNRASLLEGLISDLIARCMPQRPAQPLRLQPSSTQQHSQSTETGMKTPPTMRASRPANSARKNLSPVRFSFPEHDVTLSSSLKKIIHPPKNSLTPPKSASSSSSSLMLKKTPASSSKSTEQTTVNQTASSSESLKLPTTSQPKSQSVSASRSPLRPSSARASTTSTTSNATASPSVSRLSSKKSSAVSTPRTSTNSSTVAKTPVQPHPPTAKHAQDPSPRKTVPVHESATVTQSVESIPDTPAKLNDTAKSESLGSTMVIIQPVPSYNGSTAQPTSPIPETSRYDSSLGATNRLVPDETTPASKLPVSDTETSVQSLAVSDNFSVDDSSDLSLLLPGVAAKPSVMNSVQLSNGVSHVAIADSFHASSPRASGSTDVSSVSYAASPLRESRPMPLSDAVSLNVSTVSSENDHIPDYAPPPSKLAATSNLFVGAANSPMQASDTSEIISEVASSMMGNEYSDDFESPSP
jgi:hypothetical protein